MSKEKKVLLLLVDGMRPDSLKACGSKAAAELLSRGHTILGAQTVVPPVTLPCHMSLFHSVPPKRHGILTNTYVPPVKEVAGLFEILKNAGKRCASIYNWEKLRELSRPGSLAYSCFISEQIYDDTDNAVVEAALQCIERRKPDFMFLYLGLSDEEGHRSGWMSPEYLHRIACSWDSIKRVYEEIKEEYFLIITSDHGGHDRSHGVEMEEDMTIPMVFIGDEEVRIIEEGANILDLAPTIAEIMGVNPDPEWEGKCLIR